MRVLFVGDDRELGASLYTALSYVGFAVDLAQDGPEGEYLGNNEPYDAVVLDLCPPAKSGMDILSGWRLKGNTVPVMVLSECDSFNDKVEGLNAGADDYLSKPFHLEELIARLDNLARGPLRHAMPTLTAPGLRLEPDHQVVRFSDGSGVTLTGMEYRLFHYFVINQGKMLSKSRLISHVYAQESGLDSNIIEVYVRRLRCKIGKERIVTRRGQGYTFR